MPSDEAGATPSQRAQRSRGFKRLQRRLAHRVRQLREEQGLTLEGAEAASDVDWKHLAKIEHSQSNPTLVTLYRIARGLKVDVAELLVEPAPPPVKGSKRER